MKTASIDTGGTFTDAVITEAGSVRIEKVASTPNAPDRAFMSALDSVASLAKVTHGTTVATNALLTDSLAPTLLVTTPGFEDVLEVGRQARSELYDLAPPPRMIPASYAGAIGAGCRIDRHGERISNEPGEIDLKRAVEKAGAEAAAISLLFSFVDATYERALASRLSPIPVSLSSEVLPLLGEYERSLAVLINAGLLELMGSYLGRIEKQLAARHNAPRLRILGSHGGNLRPEIAARLPVRTLLSGPAGGVAASYVLADSLAFEEALSIDVGGTSADICWIKGGHAVYRERGGVAGYDIELPRLPVDSIGAGGGSIVHVDRGVIRVGPHSAGADPGPAAYGRGGPATVTDCLLLLDRLPEMKLAADVRLSREYSRRALGNLAGQIGRSLEETARIALEVITENMARSCRLAAAREGSDPGDAVLIPFGGAGGLMACDIAESIGIRRIALAAGAGVMSAIGMAVSPARALQFQTVLLSSGSVADAPWENLIRAARKELGDEESVHIHLSARCRYRGQTDVLNVPCLSLENRVNMDSSQRLGFSQIDLENRFNENHETTFGFRRATEIEVRDIVVEAISPLHNRFRLDMHRDAAIPTSTGRHPCVRLPDVSEICGPVIVIDSGATAFLQDGWKARQAAGPWGTCLIMDRIDD